MKKYISLITLLISTTCFSQQSNFEFYSKFTTEFKNKDTLDFLNNIESKIKQKVSDIAIGKSNWNITAYDAFNNHWLVPMTFQQIMNSDTTSTKLSTNKYETFFIWNNSIDTIQLLGFSRDYRFASTQYYSDTNNLTRPFFRIPLSDYKNIIDNSDYNKIKILLLNIICKKFKTIQKDSTSFIYSFNIKLDSLILNQAPMKLLIGNLTQINDSPKAYSNTDFSKPLSFNEIAKLTTKTETILNMGRDSTITFERVVKSIKVYESWKMIKYSEKVNLDVPYVAPLYTFVQKVKAIGLVYDTGAELIYDISDIENAALKSSIDFSPYKEVFKSYSMNYFNVQSR